MCVIVEFGCGEGTGVESHWVDFTRVELDGENCSQSIVGSIGLDDYWFVWNPMHEDRGGGEGGLERLEGVSSSVGEVPLNSFLSEARVSGTTIFEYSEMKRR